MKNKAKKVVAAAVSFSAALNLTACVYGPPPGDDVHAETYVETQSDTVYDTDNSFIKTEEDLL